MEIAKNTIFAINVKTFIEDKAGWTEVIAMKIVVLIIRVFLLLAPRSHGVMWRNCYDCNSKVITKL